MGRVVGKTVVGTAAPRGGSRKNMGRGNAKKLATLVVALKTQATLLTEPL